MRQLQTTLFLSLIGFALATGLFLINTWRLRTFRVSAPLDMAYYNQQLWALSRRLPQITVRPQNFYAAEGPEPWRTNHLRPITWAFVPLYRLWPRPELLYLLQSLVLGLGVFAAYHLAAIQGGRKGGILGALLYASCPGIWLLGSTDFRYMYLGIPVGLWCAAALIQNRAGAFLTRSLLWMSIREPYSVVVAALGVGRYLQTPRRLSGLRLALLAVGFGITWFWLHVLYLALAYSPSTATQYLWAVRHPTEAYGMVEGAIALSLAREWHRLLVNFLPLVLLCLAQPNWLIVGLPLLFPPMRMGLFTLHPAVQFVRYLAPALVVLLAGSSAATGRLVGSRFKLLRQLPPSVLLLNFVCCAVVVLVGPSTLFRMPGPSDAILKLPPRYSEGHRSRELLAVLDRIPKTEGVLAARGVLANLSPRTTLYDYYQPGPAVTWRDAIQRCRWLVVERRILLLASPDVPAPLREAVWESILRVSGATGRKNRQDWEEFARTVADWYRQGDWQLVYDGTNLVVLRRPGPPPRSR